MRDKTLQMIVEGLVDIYNSQRSDTPVKDMSMSTLELLSKLGYWMDEDPDNEDYGVAVKKSK